MALSKQPYKGTRDFFPKDKRQRDFIEEVMATTAETFGYEPYDGPLLEEVELYLAKSGEELINEQIYSFMDRGDRKVAIRPEMTPTVARMVAQIHREVAKPIRWYAFPNFMRYERPQKGRLREFWQFNCDIFGAPGRTGEIEILQVAVELFERFGANSSQFEILINDRKIVDTVFKELLLCNDEQTHKLYKIVDKAKKVAPEALKKMVDDTGISENAQKLFFQYINISSLDEIVSFLQNNQKTEIAQEFAQFVNEAKLAGLSEYLNFDASIVRGLDYYTGIVFEMFDKHPDNRRALCGGGAYHNLLQIFNEKPLPGVGFGLGDVTLTDFLTVHNLMPNFEIPLNDVLVTFQDPNGFQSAMKIARLLRKNDFKVVTMLEETKMKKVFELAEKKGCKNVVLIGSDEITSEKIQIKNTEKREQKDFSISDIESIINFLK